VIPERKVKKVTPQVEIAHITAPPKIARIIQDLLLPVKQKERGKGKKANRGPRHEKGVRQTKPERTQKHRKEGGHV